MREKYEAYKAKHNAELAALRAHVEALRKALQVAEISLGHIFVDTHPALVQVRAALHPDVSAVKEKT